MSEIPAPAKPGDNDTRQDQVTSVSSARMREAISQTSATASEPSREGQRLDLDQWGVR